MSALVRRTLPALALAVLVASVTTACVPEPDPAPTSASPSAQPSVTPTPTPSPSLDSPSPTPTPTATPAAHTPVKKSCDSIVSPQQVYDFNPNFSSLESLKPGGGSNIGLARTYSGTVCGWVNQTSGDILSVALSKPSAEKLAEVKAAAASLPKAKGFVGYFNGGDDAAEAQAFVDGFWVVINFQGSTAESELAPIIAAAIAAAK